VRKPTPIAERFVTKVEKTATCWLWTATIDRLGYGKIWFNGRMVKAHRAAYELAYGPIPPGMEVDHTCHNRHCVNPGHLRLATRKQNMENRAGAQSNSHSGVRGVTWDKAARKWRAQVKHGANIHYVGRFSTIEEADTAVREKRIELFTHNIVDRSRA
jgi:hypothetical protein